MTGLSLALVLLSALCHVTWNLLLKRSGNQEVFAWALLIAGSVMLAPLAAALFWFHPIAMPGWWFVAATMALHVLYFFLLGRAYSRGDLSLVYPVARGIGPMFVPIMAVLILGETVALPAAIGIVLIILGIFIVSWWGRFAEVIAQPSLLLRGAGMGYAILTGLVITVYTLVDKQGVEHVQPFLYMYFLILGSSAGLAPYILRSYGLAPVLQEWRRNAWPILASGLLVFAAYGLVLTAFSLARVSYIAPAREVGIVVSVVMGALLLKEPFGRGRFLGSAFIVAGLALIALSP